ncbi:hypothetical protein SAFG77S_02031 [Streptomyces afghaniensis]
MGEVVTRGNVDCRAPGPGKHPCVVPTCSWGFPASCVRHALVMAGETASGAESGCAASACARCPAPQVRTVRRGAPPQAEPCRGPGEASGVRDPVPWAVAGRDGSHGPRRCRICRRHNGALISWLRPGPACKEGPSAGSIVRDVVHSSILRSAIESMGMSAERQYLCRRRHFRAGRPAGSPPRPAAPRYPNVMACFSRNLLTRGDGGRSYDLRITDTFEGGTAVAHPAHSSTSLAGCGQRLDPHLSLRKPGEVSARTPCDTAGSGFAPRSRSSRRLC